MGMNKLIKEFAIEWAKYLDWDFPNDPTEYTFTSDSLSKFAALVAAHEREACAMVAQNYWSEGYGVLWRAGREVAAEIRARGEQ
jgi:hypothetical protein